MSIASMTGFARASGELADDRWTWELKSVNGRGLEVRCRLPAGFDGLEQKVKSMAGEKLRRGNVSVALQFSRGEANVSLKLNRALLDQLGEIVTQVGSDLPVQPPRLDGLLAIRGVLEVAEAEEADDVRATREAELLASFREALEGLVVARMDEGSRLSDALAEHLNGVEALVASAKANDKDRFEALKSRLKSQVEALLEASPALPEDRLAQEAALLIAKADVTEEIDRLLSHIATARDLLAGGGDGPPGRRLDFLAQEFNREANTLCSKAGDPTLTQIGLDLKVIIDRFREQAANIE